MATVTPLRILVCGHVNGHVSRLFERVCALSKKVVFDALLVTGNLFPEMSQSLDCGWMQSLLSDDEQFLHLPSSIYVFGPRTEAQKVYYRQLLRATEPSGGTVDDEEELLSRGFDALNGKITVLGRRGIITCSSGLTIAYYLEEEGISAPDKCMDQFITTINSSPSAVDIFLSAVWPKDVHQSSAVSIPDPIVQRSAAASDLISRLANRLKPRYLFAASEANADSEVGVFFERQPFRNHTVLKEPARPVTRFISLASVSSDKKGPKWLYAFNIKPGSELLKLDKESGRNEGRQELNHQPDDTTESPFKGMHLNYNSSNKKSADNVQFFYQVPGDRRQRNDRQQQQSQNDRHGHQRESEQISAVGPERPKRPRVELDPNDCWFCLASPHVEKEFIVSIADNAYLATAKGGLVEDHLLILPIEHIRSTMDTTDEAISDILKFKEALIRYFESQGKIVAFFERNFKSQHMQVQVVPLPKECLMTAEDGSGDQALTKAVIGSIRRHGLHYTVIPDNLTLRDVLNQGLPYFHFQIPAIEWQVCVNINTRRRNDDGSSIMFPMQLGREILAHILNLDPGVSHWKNVILSKDQEASRAIAFRKQFNDFDFTIENDE